MPPCWRASGYKLIYAQKEAVIHIRSWLVNGLDSIFTTTYPGLEASLSAPKVEDEWKLLYEESTWTVVLGGTLPSRADLEAFLNLLKEHITIQDDLEESHALDFHSLPGDLPDEYLRTEVGALVYRAKYQGDTSATTSLVQKMFNFISVHPRYRRAYAFAAVPPSSGASWRDLTKEVARELSQRCGKNLIQIERSRSVVSQKDFNDEQTRRERQNNTMRVQVHSLEAGKSIILVDDMYGSGATMSEASRALKEAGAREVLGLVASKTLKFTKGVAL